MKGYITRGRIEGSWYVRVELPRSADGKRRQRRETVRGTKAEAQRRLRELLREVETGGYAEGGRMSIADLAQRWLQSVEHRVGVKTFIRYKSIVRLYIAPALGSIRAEALRPGHVEEALASWSTGGRKDREKGLLSARTIGHLYDTLRTICRWGVKMGILVRNPADAVEPPRVERREMQALDPKGVTALLNAAKDTALQIPILVAIGTGLRRGELLGLRWSDVDLEAARLTVRRSVETVQGVTRTKAPKTARSARTISLAPFVVEALRRERAAQAQLRLLLGLGRDEEGWVFTRADGSAWEPGTFSLHFARLVKRSKLPHVRFHDLRHSFGTLALTSGVDLQTISRALGHESIAITSRIYVHAVEVLQQEAAGRLDAFLGHAVGDAMGGSANALPKASVPQACHTSPLPKKKARGYGLPLVAPTGIESEFDGDEE